MKCKFDFYTPFQRGGLKLEVRPKLEEIQYIILSKIQYSITKNFPSSCSRALKSGNEHVEQCSVKNFRARAFFNMGIFEPINSLIQTVARANRLVLKENKSVNVSHQRSFQTRVPCIKTKIIASISFLLSNLKQIFPKKFPIFTFGHFVPIISKVNLTAKKVYREVILWLIMASSHGQLLSKV